MCIRDRLIQCLKLLRAAGRSSVLIMSDSAVLTLRQETGSTPEDLAPLVDAVYGPGEVGAPPASGSWPAAGMLVVPCSMKTAAGICAGYADTVSYTHLDVYKRQHTPGCPG